MVRWGLDSKQFVFVWREKQSKNQRTGCRIQNRHWTYPSKNMTKQVKCCHNSTRVLPSNSVDFTFNHTLHVFPQRFDARLRSEPIDSFHRPKQQHSKCHITSSQCPELKMSDLRSQYFQSRRLRHCIPHY